MKTLKKSSKLLSLLKALNLSSKEKNKRFYLKLKICELTPKENLIQATNFIVVRYKGINYWAMFRCPCKCGTLISLSLQGDWSIDLTRKFPTLYPSVWQTRGCYSHFWVRNGKILWCKDSGIEPWKAKPGQYSDPH